jgi:Glycogen recognition site of AMP-activated protein kinase
MNDQLISMYIDDELSLDDKIDFVETVHDNKYFRDDALDLLRQEKLIRSEVVEKMPALGIREPIAPWHLRLFRPVAALATGLAAAAVLFFIFLPPQEPSLRPYRFVIYQPEAERVELAGSFSGWNKIPLKHAGSSGYWEITLELSEGDHRFSYIIEGNLRLADPTIAVRETDDFGGENSILTVKL